MRPLLWCSRTIYLTLFISHLNPVVVLRRRRNPGSCTPTRQRRRSRSTRPKTSSLHARQKTVLRRISDLLHGRIDTMAEIRGSMDVRAGSLIRNAVEGIFKLQVVSYVTGPDEPAYHHWTVSPPTENEGMCANQIGQRDDLSVLGLAIIQGAGGYAHQRAIELDLAIAQRKPGQKLPNRAIKIHGIT
ncbi:hypothetical protein AC579_8568 [Pseudocercospora musae]|uniref:Uncharacterized protein n=1 Tax=Pseudocercospora musae TaxID=113226 RepID=A0A139IA52_9PEZI|nr:hypothetical protein AC579_8568 [Pseudocercospora musae]